MRRDLCLVRHDLCVPRHDLCSLRRDLTVRFKFLYFSVKEFDEELDGEVHHRHHLLSTVALVASPGYDMAADDPDIFTDPESEPFVRAWPDQAIPRRSGPPAEIPSSITEGLIKDLQLQHDSGESPQTLRCGLLQRSPEKFCSWCPGQGQVWKQNLHPLQ